MKRWGKFSTLKERGEWVELQFMAAAASRGYHVLKPCGDSLAYDVGIEHGGLLRVQVKSTTVRNGTGYFCQPYPRRRNPQTDGKSRRHALPRNRPEEEPLPLRALPRSLGIARKNETRPVPHRQAPLTPTAKRRTCQSRT